MLLAKGAISSFLIKFFRRLRSIQNCTVPDSSDLFFQVGKYFAANPLPLHFCIHKQSGDMVVMIASGTNQYPVRKTAIHCAL